MKETEQKQALCTKVVRKEALLPVRALRCLFLSSLTSADKSRPRNETGNETEMIMKHLGLGSLFCWQGASLCQCCLIG